MPESGIEEMFASSMSTDPAYIGYLFSWWLRHHPAPSWKVIAEGLFKFREHDALKILELRFPIGRLIKQTRLFTYHGESFICYRRR